jgi:rubredoxin
MSTPPDQAASAVEEFVRRIDAFDPGAPAWGEISVRRGDEELRLTVRQPVADALVRALQAYHDPRDRGACDRCGGRRIDDNFLCRDCGHGNGLFGQMIMERVARHQGDEELASSDTSFTA